MLSRTARWPLIATAFLLLAGGEGRSPAGPAAQGQSDDEKAIRALDEAFVRDFNKGDSKALAAMFAEDAEVIEATGEAYEGREPIERSFTETFAASKGARIAFEIGSIRFLTPDAAREQGRSVVTPTEGAPIVREYTVLYVRRDGRWLISSVREDFDPTVRARDRLKDLDWMIGEWVDEGSDSVVRLDCRRSADENFLIREFTVKRLGRPVMTVTQRIGWDPVAKQFRSWEFDSEGGFGEGRWGRDGNRWVVKHTGTLPEGLTASATNVMVRERPDLVRWASTDRVVGDRPIPDDGPYALVRVPPPPGSKEKAPAAKPPTPNTPRDPR